jgi:hypothetical protein
MKHQNMELELTKDEKEMLQYCRARINVYIILQKRHGHEKACRILSIYD